MPAAPPVAAGPAAAAAAALVFVETLLTPAAAHIAPAGLPPSELAEGSSLDATCCQPELPRTANATLDPGRAAAAAAAHGVLPPLARPYMLQQQPLRQPSGRIAAPVMPDADALNPKGSAPPRHSQSCMVLPVPRLQRAPAASCSCCVAPDAAPVRLMPTCGRPDAVRWQHITQTHHPAEAMVLAMLVLAG
ncbi:hypothetical protein COO60DRAFT_711378 [Scenedesmus sp. NREL 46B-D3]|nr:hypothetical protein COO60DRAFT_711378 [Scenedesmus sp. NREL 46B-D3]